MQLCVNTVLPLAPLALGRAVLVLAGLSARHDLYAVILGAYVLWAGGLLLRQIYRLSQVRTCTLLCQKPLCQKLLLSRLWRVSGRLLSVRCMCCTLGAYRGIQQISARDQITS